VPQANGFVSSTSLMEHFYTHGAELGASDEHEYVQMAIEFLEGPIEWTETQECTRSDGDIIRFDPTTDLFAVVRPNGTIRTLFKPMPFHLAPIGYPVDQTHSFASNEEYFLAECGK
jgi:pyocin large subunit-like protein